MGDVAMTIPLLAALTKRYPNLRLTVLTRKAFFPMFEGLDNIDVLEAKVKTQHKGLRGLWRLYRQLRTENFDAVADLHNVLRSNILKRYFTGSGIPFVQIDKGREQKKALVSPKRKVFKQLKTTQERYAEVFSKLGFALDLETARPLQKKQMSANTLKLAEADNRRWIGIAPFAAYASKAYPLELMNEVLIELNNTDKYKIFLFGGGTQEEIALSQLEIAYPQVVSVVGKLQLKEELELISNLDLMVSMDSANAHLSAMFGVPTITLWGVTHPFAGFYPFRQKPEYALLADREKFPLIPTSVYGNRFPKGYEKAIATITPSDILHKINAVLGET